MSYWKQDRGRDLCLFATTMSVQTASGAHPASYIRITGNSFISVRESPPCTTEVKMR